MPEKSSNIYLLKSLLLVYSGMIAKKTQNIAVMPRKRHVSRNVKLPLYNEVDYVMPRKRHVSRNDYVRACSRLYEVMPRKRHVSRNKLLVVIRATTGGHASQEACE